MFGAKFTQNITILMLKFAEISMSKFSLAIFLAKSNHRNLCYCDALKNII